MFDSFNVDLLVLSQLIRAIYGIFTLFSVNNSLDRNSSVLLFCLFSLVVERWSCKPKVVSSILTGGKVINFFFRILQH